MVSTKNEHEPKSFGDYLNLSHAASLVGVRLVEDWLDSDLKCLSDEAESDAKDRAERVHSILLELLFGGQVSAHGVDDAGAYTKLSRTRLSKPFFDIDIARSLFRWTPEDWAVIFVSKKALKRYLAEVSDIKPRKSITFDWQEITSKAWKLALNDRALLKSHRLIGAVQDAFVAKYDGRPDDKELRGLVNDIIDHLGEHSASREDSFSETSSDIRRDSV